MFSEAARQVFQELYYFDKPKNLVTVEKCIDTFRKTAKPTDKNKKIRLKVLKKMAKAIGDEWNFKEVAMAITYEEQLQDNAFCQFYYKVPPKRREECFEFDPKTKRIWFKDDQAPIVKITIAASLTNTYDFTSAEVMAIILHEIGHTLANNAMVLANRIERYKNIIDKLNKFNIFGMSDEKINSIGKFIDTKICSSGSTGISGDYGTREIRAEENFSDQFATIYGYGRELMSALHKMDMRNPYFKEGKTMDQLNKLDKIMISIGDFLSKYTKDLSTHPNWGGRVRGVISALEYELKTNPKLSPKEKKLLEQQIKDLKLSLMNFLDAADDKLTVNQYKKDVKRQYDTYDQGDKGNRTRGLDYLILTGGKPDY